MVLPVSGGRVGTSSNMDEWDLVPEQWGEDINMEIGHADDDPFSVNAHLGDTYNENDESAQISIPSQMGTEYQDSSKKQGRRNKGVKRWKPEWANTHKWAYVDDTKETKKIFCSVCKEYGQVTKKNPFGNEGSKNMQLSALTDHANSLLHKEALRLQERNLVLEEWVEDINMEIGHEDDDLLSVGALIGETYNEEDESAQISIPSQMGSGDQDLSEKRRKRNKVVDIEGTEKIFCSVCKNYGRESEKTPCRNEGSKNMQLSALVDHGNSFLHKEAFGRQSASDVIEKPKAFLSKTVGSIVEAAWKRDPNETEFRQCVEGVSLSLDTVISGTSCYIDIMERLLEPEHTCIFRVTWTDDQGQLHLNRGFHVQFNQTLGSRGGLHFHPSMNMSMSKFLGFQQTFKTALTSYRLGGAAAGSDFDPKGKSDIEIMRFCQSFMGSLCKYLDPEKDIFSEDMGVGESEMGYMLEKYRQLASNVQGSRTLTDIMWSSSSLRTEATAYGLVFFLQLIFAHSNKDLKGLRCIVSGSGKIALHVLKYLIYFGAVPVTVSDSKGYLLDEDGFDHAKLITLRKIKAHSKDLRDYSETYVSSKYLTGVKPWHVKCDVAIPCAYHNEIELFDAMTLVQSGCRILVEGSNMPCTPGAVKYLMKANVVIAPAIAAGAGGIIAGELALRNLPPPEIQLKLEEAMREMHQKIVKTADYFGYSEETSKALVHGATIAAFLGIADGMSAQGCL